MIKIKSTFLLFFLLVGNISLFAQNNSDFQLATRLMQQQRYADALPMLQDLVEEEPQNYIYSDRLIDCHIQLKQYDEGLAVAQNFKNRQQNEHQITIRIGELYHFKGEKEKAFEIWHGNLEEHPNQLQLYINTANTMIERREYLPAVDVYKSARERFKNNRLFFGDIANAYMQAGEYEQAIDEWLNLLEESPEQLTFIQRSLLRYDDPILYDITIVELGQRLQNITVNNKLYQPFYQLQIWLLQENKLYRRALAAAKNYESSTSAFNYSLFNLGRQLSLNNEFELAVEAFSFYLKNAFGEVKWRNMEELSNTYSQWAKFIDDYNLDFHNKKDSLYRLSISMVDSILNETDTYSRLHHVYLKKAELSLDFIFDLKGAEEAYDQLASLAEMQNSPELPYLQGRIHLANKEYSLARISFTKANKQAGIGELAEKTRYFLALTDFYAGDYEFATIQLKSLGRQNTSYYANDALELRLWLQEGLAADSTGNELDIFADAVFKDLNGKSTESADQFLEMINRQDVTALKDDAMLFILNSAHISDSVKFTELSSFLATNLITPKKEELLWEQAKLAEKIDSSISAGCEGSADCINEYASTSRVSAKDIYEELILSFPQGFYAPYARERLSKLSQENS